MTPLLAAGAIEAGDLVRFWTALAVLLIAARGLGLVARRIGQPSVIGELAAGVVLGPTLLGRASPELSEWLFGGDVSTIMLSTVSWLGVVLLLAITGFETDLGLLRRLGRAAAWTSATSLVLPFALGLGLATVLPTEFRGGEGDGAAFVLFMGVALAISALPVVAKVLREMGVIARPIGQVTLAAGMVNDLVGWVLLGLVAGLARTGTVDAAALAVTIAGIVAFLGLAITVGQRGVDALLRSAAERDTSASSAVGVALVVVVVLGAVTQALGVEAVLGAFVAGILLSRSPLGGRRVEHQVSAMTDGFLAPIFFATAGLQVDLGGVVAPDVLGWAVAVVAVATVGKVLGGLLGGRLGGLSTLEGLAVGVGLNARGALEIVVATIGLGLGVLSEVAYSVVVVMAVLTSMLAPPALTLIGRRMGGAGVRADSTSIATARRASRILGARAALLPTRGGESSVLAGHLLDMLLPADTAITALTVHPPELDAERGRQAAREVGRLVRRRLAWRDRVGQRAAESILAEARLGYDVIAVGASAEAGGRVLSPVLADILSSTRSPVLIVRGADGRLAGDPIRTIMAAVDGTPVCDAARDVAASLATAVDAGLHLVHVTRDLDLSEGGTTQQVRRAIDRVSLVGRAAQARASTLGVNAALRVQAGSDVAAGILRAAQDDDADLVIIGAQVRAADGDAVLGRTVERLLEATNTTVLVVAFPPQLEEPNG